MPPATRKPSATSTKKNGKIVSDFSEFDRETKNAFRFTEDLPKGKDRGDIGTVYLLKSALDAAGIDPEMGVRVTVEQLPED